MNPERFALSPEPATSAESSSAAPGNPHQPPLLYHPIVAVSLILILASIAQLNAWLISRFVPPASPPLTLANDPAAYPLLDMLFASFSVLPFAPGTLHAVTPALYLLISLGSAVLWYVAARIALGPLWGLWCGGCWAVHPLFAFTARQPGPLVVLLVLMPAAWMLLLCWHDSRRWRTAFLAGITLGLLAIMRLDQLALLPLVILATVFGRDRVANRWLSASALLIGCSMSLLPWWMGRLNSQERAQHLQDLQARLQVPLLTAADEPQPLTRPSAAAASAPPNRIAPGSVSRLTLAVPAASARASWLAGRLWRSLYATSHGRLQRPLFVLQLIVLAPALWGFWIALRHPPWRWMATTAAMFTAVEWCLVAITQPLARNLTPIGGLAVLFALLGAAAVYERLFGRNLTDATESRPAE